VAHYFLLLDATSFEKQIRPALAASWQKRSFEPCRDLCTALLPAARSYLERYHAGPDEPLLSLVSQGLPFDRDYWRHLVSEMLLFSAVEIPEVQVCEDTLCCLLAPANYRSGLTEREHLAPIQQVHRGTRDLTFGTAIYRPEYAGYNNCADVARLAEYLTQVRPERWTAADLRDLREVSTAEDREEELAFAREWFPALRAMYERAWDRGEVIVQERIY
jgi:hypothetical protein